MRGCAVFRAAWAALIVASCGSFASAQSTDPQPRVAYPMHSARINQIRATPDFARLVTIGEDKTIHVWRLADLRLLRAIPVPSEPGTEGAVRSLVTLPGNREVIVGGITGFTWHGASQLYRFDLDSGRLLQTFGRFPASIETLAISRDGKRVAVGLANGYGLRIVDVSSGETITSDAEYGGTVVFVDFAPGGQLASTSYDGCVRVYDADGRLIHRVDYPLRTDDRVACKGSQLGGVRFSPDGEYLAFGMQDRNELVLVDAATRRIVKVVRADDAKQRSLCCLNWSHDGKALYVDGLYDSLEPAPLYRIALLDGRVVRSDVARQAFTNLLPLPDGQLVFSTEGPSLVRVDASGRVMAEVTPPSGDFRFPWTAFRVSDDGSRIVFAMQTDGTRPRRFAIEEKGSSAFRDADPQDLAATRGPVRAGSARVETRLDDFAYKAPTLINGKPLSLAPLQSVRSWAAGSAGRTAFGTQWSVLVADANARKVWERTLPAPAWQVNATADGRWVVAAVGDGTIRWYDAASGDERLALFPHRDGVQWIAWRPDGFYASSVKGDDLMGWLVNRGDRSTPDFIRAVQFERALYRPELIRAALKPAGAPDAAANLRTILAALAPPRVTIESVQIDGSGRAMTVQFTAEATGRPISEIGAYVDGVPVLTAQERIVPSRAAQTLRRTIVVPAQSGPSLVRIEAETDASLGVDETLTVEPVRQLALPKGRLFVVAMGVSRFERVEGLAPLPNAANDARDLAGALAQHGQRAFSEVRAVVLTEEAKNLPTKAALLEQLGNLRAMTVDDTLIVFLASHGGTDASDYYFVTRDARTEDIRKLVAARRSDTRLSPGSVPSLLTGTELTAALRKLPGRRILILDTCHASAAGSSDPYSLIKRSASAQLAVMSAAREDESSYDSPTKPHGAFTLALLDALDGRASLRAGPVTLREVFDAAAPQVQEAVRQWREATTDATVRASIRQTPVLSATATLEATVIAVR